MSARAASVRACLAAIAAACLLMLALGSANARAAGPITLGSVPAAELPVDGGDAAGNQTAIYVDPSGTAHVAWIVDHLNSQPPAEIMECTIPLGASSCGGTTVLQTNGNGASWSGSGAFGSIEGDPSIDGIKYLPDSDGTAYLAVAISQLGPATAPFGEAAPYSEIELFAPGSTSGVAVGGTEMTVNGLGDVDLAPDASGIEVLGDDESVDNADTEDGTTSTPAPGFAYEYESLAGAASNSTPQYLPGQTAGDEAPVDITTLPDGQVAVLAYNFTNLPNHTTTGAYPVSIAVQPAAGGTFGPLTSLGISGPVVAASAPSAASYILNLEDSRQGDNLLGIYNSNTDPMELYQFRGTQLKTVAAIGTAANDEYPEDWASEPPVYEDAGGDLLVGWLAQGGEDGCPATVNAAQQGDSNIDSGCLMYRRIGDGGLLGPKIVLSTEPASDILQDGTRLSAASISAVLTGLGAIAVNAHGIGWMLDFRDGTNSPDSTHPTGQDSLYAQPLPSSLETTAPPKVSGTSVSVGVKCAGATACGGVVVLSATLVPIHQAQDARATSRSKRSVVIASLDRKVAAGSGVKLVVRLNAAGRRLLAREHRLKGSLVVSQRVGALKTPAVLLQQTVTLRRR